MNSKIRVAILIDAWFPFYGGGQVHVRELSKAMAGDCEFTVYHAKSAAFLDRALWALRVIPEVVNSHREKQFDLIHAHAYIAGIPGKILSLILGIPVVYTVHGCSTLDLWKLKQSGRIRVQIPFWKYLLEKWLLTGIRYQQQISVTKHFLEYKNLNKNISQIPNGVDTKDFDAVKVSKRREFTVLFIGRDDPVKGIKFLDKAIAIVKSRQPEIAFKKITGGIDKRSKLIRIYKSCHLFVLPSLVEGHPLTILEAWAARLPVVATDVGDNSRMLKAGLNGFLVPPGDAKALSDTIIKAFENPRLEQLGQSGYNLVKKRYTWKRAAKATLAVYKEVINGNRQNLT